MGGAVETKKERIGFWAIEYVKKNPEDWSKESQKIWEEKQEYDRQLFVAGKSFMAGIFKPDGYPNNWVVFLQPMRKSEAQKIMENDPSVKSGIAIGNIRMFVTYLPGPGQTTTWDYPEEIKAEHKKASNQ
jgi:hypothetical protein